MGIFFDWYIWYFLLLGLFEMFLIYEKQAYCMSHPGLSYEDAYDYRADIWFAVLVFLPMFFIAGFRDLWYCDTGAYVIGFNNAPSNLSDFELSGTERAPGFEIFIVLFKQFISTDYRLWLLIIAGISVLCMCITFRRYTTEIVLCAFLFMAAGECQSWLMNGMRQFLAAAVLFAATPLVLSKKKSKWLIFILLALFMYTFHISAIVALPVYFIALGKPFGKKTMSVLFLILLSAFFADTFTDIFTDVVSTTNYSSITGEMIGNGDVGTKILRVLVYCVPAGMAVVFRKKIPDDVPDIIKYSINMSMMTGAFYILSAVTSGIYFGRFPIYFSLFNYILLPWEIRTFFAKNDRKFVYWAMIVLYSVFYYFSLNK